MVDKNKKMTITREGREDFLEMFYEALANNDEHSMKNLNIPHSSVFYVREKIELDTGIKYSLRHVEKAMKAEGML